MVRTETILLGRIARINASGGSVIIKRDRNFTGDFPEGPVFIEADGRPVPFFTEYVVENPDGSFRVRFEDYGTFEKIKEFSGCNILVASDSKSSGSGDRSKEITGFSVFDENDELIGIIEEVIESPGQYILRLSARGKEVLLPFHEDLIISADPSGKKLVMISPEGLVDLNG